MSSLANSFRAIAETHDDISETSRDAADASKAAALAGLSPDKRRRLVEGLGAATDDKQRVKAVADLYTRCARLAGEVEGEFGLSDQAKTELTLLGNLLHQLQMVYMNELLRDIYRDVASAFD